MSRAPSFRLLRACLPLAGGVLFLLALSGCSLAGDIQPPPGYPTASAVEAVSSSLSPIMPPDPSASADLYAAKCAPCHGASGMGDGVMAGQLAVPAPAIGSPEIARAASPAEWFDVISNGRMSRNMPPFSGSLTERQRWDMVAYVMSMSVSKEQLAQGRSAYVMLCQDCHGESGKGNGLRAAGLSAALPDWTNPASLSQMSDEDIWRAITEGAGAEMPGYADSLKPEMRWALASYVRTLGFVPGSTTPQDNLAAAQPAQPAAESQPADAQKAAVLVKVSNGSGGQVPAGLEVTLQAFDQMQPAAQYTCTVQPDQTCPIQGVDLGSGRVYIAFADYQDQRYLSSMVQAPDLPAGEQTELPLAIYDTTSDRSQLSATRLHVFFQFPEAGLLRVSELFLIANPTNQVALMQFKAVEGASDLQVEDVTPGDRHIASLLDDPTLVPLLPGSDPNQILVVYNLPYNRKLPLSLEMPLPVQSVMVMVPAEEGVHLQSAQLQAMGQQSIQGANIELYGVDDLSAGQAVQMTLSGRLRTAPRFDSGTLAGMLFGGAVFFIVLGVSGMWVFRRRQAAQLQPEPAAPAEPLPPVDEILDAIVTLDDLYRSGQLPLDAYQERRAQLKDKLRRKKQESGK